MGATVPFYNTKDFAKSKKKYLVLLCFELFIQFYSSKYLKALINLVLLITIFPYFMSLYAFMAFVIKEHFMAFHDKCHTA